MAETRHRTVVEVDVDASAAREKLAELLAIQQQLNQALGGGRGGGTTAPSGGAQPGGGAPPASGGGAGGGSSAPGGGAPRALPGRDSRGRFVSGDDSDGGFVPTTRALPGRDSRGRFISGGDSDGGAAAPGGGAPGIAPFDWSPFYNQRWGRGAGGVVQGAGSVITSGAGAGLALAGGAASGLGGLMQKLAADETNSGAVRGIAGALSNALVPGAAAAAITMMATNYRMQVAQRRGELDTQNALAGMTGSGVSYGGAAKLGFTPEEAVANAVAFSQGAGFERAGGTPLGLVRTGTSIGALAAYRGQMAAGAGGVGDANMRAAVGLAQSSGLRGSKVDEYLQAIAANTGSLASQGLRTSIPGLEDFLRRAAVTPGLGGTGMSQVRALSAVTGTVSGARSQLLSPFQGLGENVLMSYAASRAGSGVGAVQVLERLTPSEIVQVLRDSGLPPEAIQGYLMSRGLHSTEAAGVGMMDLAGDAPAAPRTRGYGASALKVASAQREAALVGLATNEDVALFQTQQTMDKAIMALGAGGRDVSAFLIDTIGQAMTGVSGMLQEAVSALQGILAAVKQ